MKRVSVIIPAKNRHEFTRDALKSIYSQNLPQDIELEVIVIDDLSIPPLSRKLKKEFPKVKFTRNISKKHGPGPSRNIGLRKATGDYIAFVDNDDQWRTNFLKICLKTLKKTKAPATACLTWPYFYGEYPIKEVIKLILLNIVKALGLTASWLFNNGRLPKSGFYLCQISHMLFDAKIIKKSRFNEELIAAEDWDFIVQSTKNKELVVVPFPLVKFRYEMKSNTNSKTVREKKWAAYNQMLEGIPYSHKRGIFYPLFLKYISVFS